MLYSTDLSVYFDRKLDTHTHPKITNGNKLSRGKKKSNLKPTF